MSLLPVIRSDFQVYLQKLDDNGHPLGGPTLLPGSVKSIATASLPSGSSNIFVIGMDDLVYFMTLDPTGTPITSYTPIPNTVQANEIWAPPVAANGGGLFAIGTDSQVLFHKFDTSGNPVGGYITIPDQGPPFRQTTLVHLRSSW